jgi:starvation-inducible outer membrane lipoprotein
VILLVIFNPLLHLRYDYQMKKGELNMLKIKVLLLSLSFVLSGTVISYTKGIEKNPGDSQQQILVNDESQPGPFSQGYTS